MPSAHSQIAFANTPRPSMANHKPTTSMLRRRAWRCVSPKAAAAVGLTTSPLAVAGVRMTFGTYPATSLAKAHTLADEARRELEAGRDPRTALASPETLGPSVRNGPRVKPLDYVPAKIARRRSPALSIRPLVTDPSLKSAVATSSDSLTASPTPVAQRWQTRPSPFSVASSIGTPPVATTFTAPSFAAWPAPVSPNGPGLAF